MFVVESGLRPDDGWQRFRFEGRPAVRRDDGLAPTRLYRFGVMGNTFILWFCAFGFAVRLAPAATTVAVLVVFAVALPVVMVVAFRRSATCGVWNLGHDVVRVQRFWSMDVLGVSDIRGVLERTSHSHAGGAKLAVIVMRDGSTIRVSSTVSGDGQVGRLRKMLGVDEWYRSQ